MSKKITTGNQLELFLQLLVKESMEKAQEELENLSENAIPHLREQEEEVETRAAVVAARTLKWDYKVLHGQLKQGPGDDYGLQQVRRELAEAGKLGWELVTFESATFEKSGGFMAGFMGDFADADNYEKGWIAVFKRPKG